MDNFVPRGVSQESIPTLVDELVDKALEQQKRKDKPSRKRKKEEKRNRSKLASPLKSFAQPTYIRDILKNLSTAEWFPFVLEGSEKDATVQQGSKSSLFSSGHSEDPLLESIGDFMSSSISMKQEEPFIFTNDMLSDEDDRELLTFDGIGTQLDLLNINSFQNLLIPQSQAHQLTFRNTVRNQTQNFVEEEFTFNQQRFQRQNVSGRGMRCFFNAVGLDVQTQITEMLSPNRINDPINRFMIANEIVNVFRDNIGAIPAQILNALDGDQAFRQEATTLDRLD